MSALDKAIDGLEWWMKEYGHPDLAAEASDLMQPARAELAALRANAYPHMCHMDHEQIGHANSSEPEELACPVCRERIENAALRKRCEDLSLFIEEWMPLVEAAMRQANRDGAEYDIQGELDEARRALRGGA